MKQKSLVYDKLCAECHRKMNLLYRLQEVPAEYSHAGIGRCGLCNFAGALTEYCYDPVRDKRTPEERAAIKAQLAASTVPKFRRTEAERENAKDYGWTQETFDSLDRMVGADE